MTNRNAVLILMLALLLLLCCGCNIAATMPYGSEEYENGDWSVDELVDHFEDLGFTDIDVEEYTTFDESKAKIQVVVAEDSSSWFPSYRDFEKGETVDTLRNIIIRETKFIPVLSAKNCPEFAELMNMDSNSTKQKEALSVFMQTHKGEYIEFYGRITKWQDQWWYIGIDFTVDVEEKNSLYFSWDTIATPDLKTTGKYASEKYTTGLITEGMQVHMRVKIDTTKDGYSLSIDSMQIIE